MNKRRPHISIPLNIYEKIQIYANNKKITISEAICQLVSLGLNNIDLTKSINKNNALLDKIYSRTFYFVSLVEQLYSDLEIGTLSNPNKNETLSKFKSKYNKYTNDD